MNRANLIRFAQGVGIGLLIAAFHITHVPTLVD